MLEHPIRKSGFHWNRVLDGNMAHRNQLMNRKLQTQMCAVAAVLIMVASAFVVIGSPDRSSADPAPSTEHSIAYHYDAGDTVSSVSVKYYGIAATEYNPEFWSGTVDGVSTGNWAGPSEDDLGMVLARSVIGNAADFTYHLKRIIDGSNQYVTVTVGDDFTVTLVQYADGAITYPIGEKGTILTLNGVEKEGKAYSNGYKVQFPGEPAGSFQTHFDIEYVYESSSNSTKIQFTTKPSGGTWIDNSNGTGPADISLTLQPDKATASVPSVNKVFGGWILSYDSTGIIYPGDVVGRNVTNLYAKWVNPDLFYSGFTFSGYTNEGTVFASDLAATVLPYKNITGFGDAVTSNFYNDKDGDGVYVSGVSGANDSMFRTIFHITSNIDSTTDSLPAGSYRSSGYTEYNVGDNKASDIRLTASGIQFLVEDDRAKVVYLPSGVPFVSTVEDSKTSVSYPADNLTGSVKRTSDGTRFLINESNATIVHVPNGVIVGKTVIDDSTLYTISVKSHINFGGDSVLDNVKIKQVNQTSKKLGETNNNNVIHANYHRLIIGTGVEMVEPVNDRNISYAPYVMAGNDRNLSTVLEEDKVIVSENLEEFSVDIATFVIIHSGTYSFVCAGAAGYAIGGTGNNDKAMSTYLVLKGGTILGLVGGTLGNGSVTGVKSFDSKEYIVNQNISGNIRYTDSGIQFFVENGRAKVVYIPVGVSLDGSVVDAQTSASYPADDMTSSIKRTSDGIRFYVKNNKAIVTYVPGGAILGTTVFDFNAQQGGTFLYAVGVKMTGDRYEDYASGFDNPLDPQYHDIWQVDESTALQGGSNNKEVRGSSHVFVSGKSSVFDVQGGGRRSSSTTDHTYVEISGNAAVRHMACGTITDGVSSAKDFSSVKQSEIYVVGNPHIAMLLGAGYDTWSSYNNSSMTSGTIKVTLDGGTVGYLYGGGMRGSIGTTTQDVNITINLNGGTVVNDVFGGGRGGLDKIHHDAKSTLPTGKMGRWEGTASYGNNNSTGYSKVYGNITITLDGTNIGGNLYGGGESFAAVNVYMKNSSDNSMFTGVGAVEDVAVVFGDINITIKNGTVGGSVYGGGKGIAIDGSNNPIITKDVAVREYGSNPSLMAYYAVMLIYNDREGCFCNIPWLCDSGCKSYDVTYRSSSYYADYARVEGNITVEMTGGTVFNNLYGGGALGKVKGNIDIHLTGGEIIGTVYGGGLGTVGNISTTGKRRITVAGTMHIYGSIYGGSALGTDGLVATFSGGSYSGEYDALIYVEAGIIDGSIFGGGFKGTTYANVHIFVGKDSLALDDKSVIGDLAYIAQGKVKSGSNEYTIESTNCNILEDIDAGVKTGVKFILIDGNAVVIHVPEGVVQGDIESVSDGTTTYDSPTFNTEVKEDAIRGMRFIIVDGNAVVIHPEPIRVTIGESIYIGGDVGELTDSSQAYTQEIVMGGGELYMAKSPDSDNLRFTGSIMGAGNSCLTHGETSIYIKDYITFAEHAAECIHRATNVTIDGCTLELDGRATIENTLANINNTQYSLYRIEHLNMKNGALLVFNSAVNYIYELNSLNPNGDPAPSTTPSNKIVVGGGNMFVLKALVTGNENDGYEYIELIKKNDPYQEIYGKVTGHVILSNRSDEQNYGAFALGSPESLGGFVVLKSGSFKVCDYSDLYEDCRCWYLAGSVNNEVTASVKYNGTETGKVDVSVSMPSLQNGSSYRYTGGTFVPSSPGTDYMTSGDSVPDNKFRVTFGWGEEDEPECLIFGTNPTPRNGTILKDDFGQSDPILGQIEGLSDVRNPHMNIKVESNISEHRYIGYVVIYVNEVVEVMIGGNPSYIVVNSIQTTVHIYTEASSFKNTSINIGIVNGSGSATFMIPAGMAGYTVVVNSVSTLVGSGVNSFALTAVKNLNNTPGWTDSLGTFVLRTDGSAQPTKIGTLQGGYSASLLIQVNSFSSTSQEKYVLELRFKDGDSTVKTVFLTLIVDNIPDISVVFTVNENTQVRYTYPYGTQLMLPDCPPTDDHFVGWYTDSDFINPYGFNLPLTKDLALYARYMFEVTLDYMDGTTSKVYVAMPSGTIGAMELPTREGYDFGGWYTSTEYIPSELWNPMTSLVTSDMTLYAFWNGWNVVVQFKWVVDGEERYIDLDQDPNSDGIINAQIMEFGKQFNTHDIMNTTPPRDMLLLEWAQYLLEQDGDYRQKGYKFVYWTYDTDSEESSKSIAVYQDTYLYDVGRLLKDGGGYADLGGKYVVVLSALVSKVAINVEMESSVMHNGVSVDNLALVDPPSSFLIFPDPNEERTDAQGAKYYDLSIELNGATRPGYSLEGWFIESPDEEIGEIPRGSKHLYEAGSLITVKAVENLSTGGDHPKGTYPWILKFIVAGEQQETMYLTQTGANRMFSEGDETNLLTLHFQSEWEQIPYSVSIANPAHGNIYATYDNGESIVRITDHTLHYGDIITLVFTADEGYDFHHWYSSGEGIFENINGSSTTFVVQGDTSLSAYLIGPQIVRVFVEYKGLYDGKVYDGGTAYDVDTIADEIKVDLTTRVHYIIINDNGTDRAIVIYKPNGIDDPTVVYDRLTEIPVLKVITDINTDSRTGVKYIVDGENIIVVDKEMDSDYLPDLYWKNGDTKVYFTKSVYTLDMVNDDHTLVQYIGTATLGNHPIFLEGREFVGENGLGEYNLGTNITSTQSHNAYYIMTDDELYTKSDVSGEERTSTDGFGFVITGETEALITSIPNSSEVTIPATVTDKIGGKVYTVTDITSGSINGDTSLRVLTYRSEVIYRNGYVTVYTNGIKDHTRSDTCDDIAGIGSGIASLKEYVLKYAFGTSEEVDPSVDRSTHIYISIEAGYYRYSETVYSGEAKTEPFDLGEISGTVITGAITQTPYVIKIYRTTDLENPGLMFAEINLYFGDNYLETLNDDDQDYKYVSHDSGSYLIYGWYIGSDLITSTAVCSGTPGDVTVVGLYLENSVITTIWIRTQLLDGTFTVNDPDAALANDGKVYYCVEAIGGFVAKYDTDSTTAIGDGTYLMTHVYDNSQSIGESQITFTVASGNSLVITYYRESCTVVLYDALHEGESTVYFYDDVVVLTHSADTPMYHYDGWTKDGATLRNVPAEGYYITVDDIGKTIEIRETYVYRMYHVDLITARGDIEKGDDSLGRTVGIDVYYGSSISSSGKAVTIEYTDYAELSTPTVTLTYTLTGSSEYDKYYDTSASVWVGVPNSGVVTEDLAIVFKWVPRTYTIRVVTDEFTSISGYNGTSYIVFDDVEYTVKSTTYLVSEGSKYGVKFAVYGGDAEYEYAYVYHIPDGITVEIDSLLTVGSVTYKVKGITEDVKEDSDAGVKFIVVDWAEKYVAAVDWKPAPEIDDNVTEDGSVIYTVKSTTYLVSDGSKPSVRFAVYNGYAYVYHIPNGITVEIDDELTVDSATYEVKGITEDVKEDSDAGAMFIVVDSEAKYAAAVDWKPAPVLDQTLVQDGPQGYTTRAPSVNPGYGANIRLTLVFAPSHTLDEPKCIYVNPVNGDRYVLQPVKQSSVQEYTIEFFITGDIEITIASKWVGEHVTFYVQGTEGGSSLIDPSMTLQVGRDETLYVPVASYEYIERLNVPGYYFDGWFTSSDCMTLPTVVYRNDILCYEITGKTQLYARYVKLADGEQKFVYDGTEQTVSVKPEINVPLNTSDVTYTLDGDPFVGVPEYTNVNDVPDGTFGYSFIPKKVYALKDTGTYVMSDVDHVYSGTFTMSMAKRQVIVVAGSGVWSYDGNTHTSDVPYSVFGGLPGTAALLSVSDGAQSITNPGTVTHTITASISDVSNYSLTVYSGTLIVIGTPVSTVTVEQPVDGILLNGTGAIGVSMSESEITVSQGETDWEVDGTSVTIFLNGIAVENGSGAAISIGEGCDVTIYVLGDCTATGTGSAGIIAGQHSTLIIAGPGKLTANGIDCDGELMIDGTRVESVSSVDGQPGIRGETIIVRDSTVTATGGSNAPGIGAGADETVTIRITKSVVTATGGAGAAAIGSGASDGSQQALCIIEIADYSKITATRGTNAAAVGTGYRHANLTGFIDGTVTCAPADADGPDGYTDPQGIGYGALKLDEEAEGLAVYFYKGLTAIHNPVPVSP